MNSNYCKLMSHWRLVLTEVVIFCTGAHYLQLPLSCDWFFAKIVFSFETNKIRSAGCSRTVWEPRTPIFGWQCSTGHFCFAPHTHTATVHQWAFQQDLFWSRSHVFAWWQIHETFSRTNPSGVFSEEQKQCVHVCGQDKSDQLGTAN